MQITPHIVRHSVSRFRSHLRSERGAALVEYVMIVGLIAIVALIAVSTFGGQVGDMHQEIADTMVSISE
jgi:Flp pilus assembly pilin Flp